MKVFVDTRTGKNMCLIEVDYSDTVLAIKEKIKRCLRVPVSYQFLYFNNKLLLKNDVHAANLKIGPNSHLELYVPPNRNHPIHKLHQTEHSPAPSNSTQQIIHGHQHCPVRMGSNNTQVLQTEQSPVLPSNSIGQDLSSMPSLRPETTQKTSHVQDSPVMVRTNQEQHLTTEEIINSQDLSSMMKMPSFRPEPTQKISHVQDSPVMVRRKNNQEQPWPTNEIINSQDPSVMVRRNNNESRSLSEIEESLGIQDCFPSVTVESSSSNTNEVFQTVQSPEASNLFTEFDNIPDFSSVMNMRSLWPEITQKISHVQDSPEQPWTAEEIRTVQSLWPTTRTNEIINSQDLPVMVRRNNNESRSLSENEVLLGIQDYIRSATVGSSSSNTNQVFQTVQSPEASYFSKEFINIPDSPAKKRIKTSPMKLTVMVKPSEESTSILVEVNAGDNVKELRKELVKMQVRGELNLPQEGFFLILENRILNENESFWRNDVTQGDTIEIFAEYLTSDDSTTTTVQSPEASDFFKEIINIPDSPAKKKIKTSPKKLTLMVKPSEESRRILVEVNADDKVKELRKELVKMQERGELNLPQEGFFLMHEITMLKESESFEKNGLTQGATIEIFGEYFTSDDDSTTTRVPSFGH